MIFCFISFRLSFSPVPFNGPRHTYTRFEKGGGRAPANEVAGHGFSSQYTSLRFVGSTLGHTGLVHTESPRLYIACRVISAVDSDGVGARPSIVIAAVSSPPPSPPASPRGSTSQPARAGAKAARARPQRSPRAAERPRLYREPAGCVWMREFTQ